jgi:hypothetical protein
MVDKIMAGAALAGVQLGMTKAGHDWAMRNLHPNDESAAGGIAIPDDTCDVSACMELRNIGSLSKPANLPDANWDVQFIGPPCPDIPICYRTRESGKTEWSYWQAFKPTTGPQQPGAFQFAASAVNPLPVKTPSILEQGSQFRQSFRGLTFEMNSSSINNQGTLWAGQWGGNPASVELKPALAGWQPPTPEIGESLETLKMIVIKDIPQSETALQDKVPGTVEWAAKTGVYVPCWFSNPTHDFNGGDGNEWQFETGGGGVLNQVELTGSPLVLSFPIDGKPDFVDIAAGAVWSDFDKTQVVTSAGVINQHVACVFFIGIDKTSTLRLKARSGEELVPTTGSAIAPFATESPRNDPTAIAAVQAISRRLPMAFPAKYNSLGLLAPVIAGVASKVMPVVAPWLKQGVGNSARAVRDAIAGNVTGMATMRLDES